MSARTPAMLEPEVETRSPEEQFGLDDAAFRRQAEYLLENSAFYRKKLGDAGFANAGSIGAISAARSGGICTFSRDARM